MRPPLPTDMYQCSNSTHQRFPWVVSGSQVEYVLNAKVDSFPGPGGIPYSAWKCPHPVIRAALWDHYNHFVSIQ
eukprot:478788-Pyramimonas_sp.AAC.1